MNLDVNFVNNRRMRIGDYGVAARCFEDVIERYRDQAFAHYFLAKAYEKIGANEAKVAENMARYDAILATHEDWRGHADYFGLTGQTNFAAPAHANVRARHAAMSGAL
jgi:hypothetical protein